MAWFYGVLLLLVAPLIIICAVVGAKDPDRPKLDERQLAARSFCYMVSFFVLLGWCVLWGTGELIWPETMHFLGFVGILSGVLVATMVFLLLLVVKRAYYPPKTNGKVEAGLNVLLMVLWGIMFFMRVTENGFVENGRLGLACLYLEIIVLYAAVLAAMAVCNRADRKGEDTA